MPISTTKYKGIFITYTPTYLSFGGFAKRFGYLGCTRVPPMIMAAIERGDIAIEGIIEIGKACIDNAEQEANTSICR